MSAKVLTRINSWLAVLLGALGFSGCGDHQNVTVEYGCPYISLEVSGTVTNEAHQPLPDMQVNLAVNGYKLRPVLTDSAGQYAWSSYHGGSDSIDIIVTDPKGVYQSDSVRVPVETKMFEQWRHWQEGESIVHQDFQLKEK